MGLEEGGEAGILERRSCEKWLRKLKLLSLEKYRLREHLT